MGEGEPLHLDHQGATLRLRGRRQARLEVHALLDDGRDRGVGPRDVGEQGRELVAERSPNGPGVHPKRGKAAITNSRPRERPVERKTRRDNTLDEGGSTRVVAAPCFPRQRLPLVELVDEVEEGHLILASQVTKPEATFLHR